MILNLTPLSVLDLVGDDAPAILHNLTTNAVKTLEPSGPGVETFITNLKGKCVGHAMVFRTAWGYRLIGAAGQSEAVAELMDRYTIREDAQPNVRDDDFTAYLLVDEPIPPNVADSSLHEVPWLAPTPARVLLAARTDEPTGESLEAPQGEEAADTFHTHRVAAGYPWHGIDFNDSHLPQEVNREPETISFTKGCYLGQETIARLDALGQVQKKLVMWSIGGIESGSLPAVDTKLFRTSEKPVAAGEKPVGRLTSVVPDPSDPQRGVALGFARRSHFDPGTEAFGTIGERDFIAKVMET